MRKSSVLLSRSLTARDGNRRSIAEVLALLDKTGTQNTCNDEQNIPNNTLTELKPNSQELQKDNSINISLNSSNSNVQSLLPSGTTVYKVVWGKPSTKKHKSWEGDGFLEVSSKTAILRGEDKLVLSTKNLLNPLQIEIGQILTIGSKVVEVIEVDTGAVVHQSMKRAPENDSPVFRSKKLKKKAPTSTIEVSSSFSNMCNPLEVKNVQAFVLPPPTSEHQWKYNTNKRQVTSVTMDSFLNMRLRPHQREGIVFLYRCIMGYTHNHTGAILADEMGLGKTLQCIALIWTLLKQGPYGTPVIRKAIIVTPSTLCITWKSEFLKWVGRERLLPFLVDNNNKPKDFITNSKNTVMVISYERLVKHSEEIEGINFDIVVCDEAHRLKNANIKAAQTLQKLACNRRILLTGTPIQNDMQEYFVLVDMANPGILGTYNNFKEEFEEPILISQKPNCSNIQRRLGEDSSARLQLMTSTFILRRTQTLLEEFLPSKTECVICCKFSALQEKMYTTAIDDWWNKEISRPSPLSLIVLLKKICNFPHLIKNKSEDSTDDNVQLINMLCQLLPSTDRVLEVHSGKLLVTVALMNEVILEKKEKMVVVSCSTQMLDVLADVCNKIGIKYARLDGSTPIPQRQSAVASMDRGGNSSLLLLSSRAGGAGLSIPSASRLVLHDADWNPAVDMQAMARVWRDGQKKPVYIYRLLTTGSIEEKIYQRQIYKTGLSDAISDPKKVKSTLKFSSEELKDLFTANFDSESSTHDLLQCDCLGDGVMPEIESPLNESANEVFGQLGKSSESSQPAFSINQLRSWEHLRPSLNTQLLDDLGLTKAAENVTFIFRKVHQKQNS